MFCRLCGVEVKNSEEFCSSCKAKQDKSTKFCPFCGQKVKGLERFCLHCEGYLGETTISQKTSGNVAPKIEDKPKTKYCKACFAEIPKDVFYCPKCNKIADTKPAPSYSGKTGRAEKTKIKGFLLGFLLSIFGVFLTWCFGDDEMLENSWLGFICDVGVGILITIFCCLG